MGAELFEAMGSAVGLLFEPARLWYVFLGVFFGILLAVVPGVGGLVGIALLLPFTFSMDPYSGIAFLLGVITVMSTSDTIPAVLFGVPGTPTSMATVLDGYPMARRGEAGRALGAAFTSSVIGGVIGALLLLLVIPVLIPIMLAVTSAELLAFCVMGLAMVAALSGSSLLKGMAAAALGMLLAFIGQDSQTATMRWTFDLLYLWDGLHILIVALGLYAIPELADLAIQRTSIAAGNKSGKTDSSLRGAGQGFRDTIKNMPLVAKGSGISAVLGAVPALGPAIIPWIVYSIATTTTKGKSTFGKGDVRGVIAAESSNNATVGGTLIPTIALGIPGSAPMALLIGALMLQGIAPGPDMLSKNLDLTYLMVWTIVLANILGGIMAFLLSNQLAKVVTVKIGILLPLIISVVFVGALQSSRQWEDLFFLLGVGVIGWIMKRAKWSRAPLVLAFVLAPLAEKYFFIAMRLHGWDWTLRPIPLVLLAFTALGLLVMIWRRFRTTRQKTKGMRYRLRPRLTLETAFPLVVAAVCAVAFYSTLDWSWRAATMPQIVAGMGVVTALASTLILWLVPVPIPGGAAAATQTEEVHYDVTTDFGNLTRWTIGLRGVVYFAWLCGFLAVAYLIGLLPAMGPFLFAYMISQRIRWTTALMVTFPAWAVAWVVFDTQLRLAWPPAVFPIFGF